MGDYHINDELDNGIVVRQVKHLNQFYALAGIVRTA
jgi:hypothetical protein